ncbi:AtpZ/AtpI family protein [Alphaproteobacteria bacterium]|nr:AtpZ/AtpI family protein [Alphaproteobacteria bacterium]
MSLINKNKKLSDRIDAALAKKGNKNIKNEHNRGLLNTFSRVATELLTGLLIGGIMGWTIDKWLDTNPWFLIVFFLLGGAAGILNLWRVVSGKGLKIGYF